MPRDWKDSYTFNDGRLVKIDDDDDEIARDGEFVRRPMQFMDFAAVRAWFDQCMGRPQDATTPFPAANRDAEAAKAKAYADYAARISNAWKGENADKQTPPQPPAQRDAQRVKEAAYAAYNERISNAWRNRD